MISVRNVGTITVRIELAMVTSHPSDLRIRAASLLGIEILEILLISSVESTIFLGVRGFG
jgi:hypothetical protein